MQFLEFKNHRFLCKEFREILKNCVEAGEDTVLYLLELLNLGLLKHGEDIGARLLSSPLSLIGGFLTCLRTQTQTHPVYTLIFSLLQTLLDCIQISQKYTQMQINLNTKQ